MTALVGRLSATSWGELKLRFCGMWEMGRQRAPSSEPRLQAVDSRGPWLPGTLRTVTASPCAFQNQLLTKGMVILRDKIRFYEGKWQARVLGHAACWCGCWSLWLGRHHPCARRNRGTACLTWAPGALGRPCGSPGQRTQRGQK